tara:strand:- start:160 stop:501 length:342 start_codon:yes stop_codon:yes gene_type:complete
MEKIIIFGWFLLINKGIKMHYRVTKVYHEEGKREELVEVLDSKKEILDTFEGLKSVRMVGVSETSTIAVSEYETEEHLKSVEHKFQEVMIDLMPLMTSPPEVHNGNVFWSYEN